MGNAETYTQTIIIEESINSQQQQPQQAQRKVFKQAKRPTPQEEIKKTQSLPKQSDKEINKEKSINFKNQGNQCILNKQFQKAIENYTQAIALHNDDSIYFSNRAVAYRLMNNLIQAKIDAIKALQMDPENARAQFLLGTIYLLEVQKDKQFDESLLKKAMEGVRILNKADEILKQNKDESKKKLKASINQNMGKARRVVFLIAQEMDKRNIKTLQDLLVGIAKRQGKQLDMDYISKAIQMNILQDVRAPEYLNCAITQEMMQEPVLFNSGHTYEKDSIIQALKLNGPIDPKTREEIYPNLAIYNKQLHQGIIELKSKSGWLGIEDESDIKDIIFE